MSESSTIQTTCAICGKPLEGEKGDWDTYLKQSQHYSDFLIGYHCQNCGAIFCKRGHEKELKFNWWSGYKKSPCPQCGEPLRDGHVILRKGVKMTEPSIPKDVARKETFAKVFGILLALVICSLTVIFTARPTEEGGLTIYEWLVERSRKKRGIISTADLNAMTEMQQLTNRGVPKAAIYAFLLHAPQYGVDVKLYPVSDQSHVTALTKQGHMYRSWTLDEATYRLAPASEIKPGIEEIQPVKITQYGDDFPAAELVFGTFHPEAYHQNIALSVNILGSCTKHASGVNTYYKDEIDEERFAKFFVVSPEEMAVLEELRELCQTKYCDIPEEALQNSP